MGNVISESRLELSASNTVAFTCEWTRLVLIARGWRYEVWSEPPPIELENVRFLAGYRRRGVRSGCARRGEKCSAGGGM